MSDYNLGTASGRIEVDGRAAALGFKTAETAAGAFFTVLDQKVQSVQTLGRRMAAVGAAGTIGFGTAIKVASDFETQMSGVRAIVNGTAEEMDSLRDKALQLGADTSFSASEAALAIEELAKAGIGVEDILNGAAEGAVALAAAGGVGLEEAAVIAANAMNQFGMGADQVVEVADILAGVANKGAADVSSLGSSLSQAGAVANLAGLSLKDTAIALGEMSDAGINGSDAGTSLKTMLNNLIPTTDRQIQKFKELNLLTFSAENAMNALRENGVKPLSKEQSVLEKQLAKLGAELSGSEVGSAKQIAATQKLALETGALNNAFFDAEGNVKNLAGLQGTLGKALEGMTREQKLASLELLFGADAMRATAIMSLEGRKGVQEYNKALKETSASEVAKARLDNLSGAMEEFRGSMETAMITIGSIFIPVLTKIVEGLTAVVNVFNSLPKGVQIAIGVLLAISSAGLLVVGMILAMLPLIAAWVANFLLMRVIGSVTGSLRVFYSTMRSGLGVQAAAVAANSRLVTSMKALATRSLLTGKIMLAAGRMIRLAWVIALGPIGILIAAVAGIVALGTVLYNRWAPFRNLMNQIGAAIREKFLGAWAAVKPILLSALGALRQFGNFVSSTLGPVLRQVAGSLLGKLVDGFNEIKTALATTLLPAVRQLVSVFRGEAMPALAAAGGFFAMLGGHIGRFAAMVGGFLLPIITAIGRAFITHVLPAIIKVAGFFGGVLIDAIVGAVKGIIQVVTGLIQIFTGLINFFKGVFTGNWTQAWNGIKQIFTGIANAIVGAIKVWFNIGILKFVGVGLRALWALVRGGLKILFTIFRGSFNLILGAVRGAWRGITSVFRAGGNAIRSVVTSAMNVIRSIIQAVMNFVLGIIRFHWNLIKAIFSGDGKRIGSLMQQAGEAVSRAGSRAMELLRSAISKGLDTAVNFFKSLPGRITGALGDLGGLLYNAGKDILQGLIEGIQSKIGEVTGMLKSVTDKIPDWKGPADVDKKLLVGNGRLILGGLLEGLESQRPALRKMLGSFTEEIGRFGEGPAAAKMLAALQNPTMAAARGPATSAALGTRPGRPSGVRRRKASKAEKRSRLVSGTLRIGPDGRVFIEGIARDVYDEQKEFEDGRRGGGRRG